MKNLSLHSLSMNVVEMTRNILLGPIYSGGTYSLDGDTWSSTKSNMLTKTW